MTVFEEVRLKYPNKEATLRRLENALSIEELDTEKEIDIESMSRKSGISKNEINDYLHFMYEHKETEMIFHYKCPETEKTIQKYDQIEQIPFEMNCNFCGEEHEYYIKQVDVYFKPTQKLIDRIKKA